MLVEYKKTTAEILNILRAKWKKEVGKKLQPSLQSPRIRVLRERVRDIPLSRVSYRSGVPCSRKCVTRALRFYIFPDILYFKLILNKSVFRLFSSPCCNNLLGSEELPFLFTQQLQLIKSVINHFILHKIIYLGYKPKKIPYSHFC